MQRLSTTEQLARSIDESSRSCRCRTALVFGIWCTVVYKLGRFYSPMFFKSYSKLALADQRNWDTR